MYMAPTKRNGFCRPSPCSSAQVVACDEGEPLDEAPWVSWRLFYRQPASALVCGDGCGSVQPVANLEHVDHRVGAQVRGELPADEQAAVAVVDEGEVGDVLPCESHAWRGRTQGCRC